MIKRGQNYISKEKIEYYKLFINVDKIVLDQTGWLYHKILNRKMI